MGIKRRWTSILQQLKEDYPNVNIQYSEFGPVIASHLGSGGLGLGYFLEKLKLINNITDKKPETCKRMRILVITTCN